ncbi:MAG: hypothetical protein RL440_1484, partial [Bacteroidota bacterium]
FIYLFPNKFIAEMIVPLQHSIGPELEKCGFDLGPQTK